MKEITVVRTERIVMKMVTGPASNSYCRMMREGVQSCLMGMDDHSVDDADASVVQESTDIPLIAVCNHEHENQELFGACSLFGVLRARGSRQ